MKRTEKIKVITPTEAERLLKFNNFVGQRNIRENHAIQLADKMVDGRFHVGSIALVDRDGETLLADGQHQLIACTLAKVPFKAVVQHYVLNGEADENAIAEIFSQFNVDAPRTRGDIAWIYACELGWSNWQRKLVSNLATALTLVRDVDSFSGTCLTKDQSAALLSEHRKVCEWVSEMDVVNRRHMNRAPVIAAMIATFSKNQKASTEFWTGVRDGEEMKARDPRYVIREFLKDVSLQGGEKNAAQRKLATRRAVYCKCIHAWNAWREDRTTQLKYHATASVPKPV